MNRILRKIKYLISAAGSLSGNGERVDLTYRENMEFETLDMYQKSHYRRYEFAQSLICGGVVGDFACGTGYGTVMLSQVAKRAIGADISGKTIEKIAKRYASIGNVTFVNKNLLDLEYEDFFDTIVSFETIEHFKDADIPALFLRFFRALKPGGQFIFSVPYLQARTEEAVTMGFHLTFDIDEHTIGTWLRDAGFEHCAYKYQNYATHTVEDSLAHKDFIICVARKS